MLLLIIIISLKVLKYIFISSYKKKNKSNTLCNPTLKFSTLKVQEEIKKRRFLKFLIFMLLFQYAQETQHEKILRGLAVGIAFTMYGRLEEADPLVASLTADKDPILRRSGMYTLAMAYCGTGNNQAIRKLLHVAVGF